MNKTTLKAYTNAIVEAALSRSVALEIELAVGFAIILECNNAKRLARETLLTVYNAAGSKCEQPGDLDWKAVNRRISAAVALFDFIGITDVSAWGEDKTKRELVDAFRPHIAALKLKSVNEVLLACDKIRAPRKPVEQSGKQFTTRHLHINVPATATRDELVELATQLMMLAHEMPVSEPFVQPEVAQPAEAVEA
jgi:hypothetical protein